MNDNNLEENQEENPKVPVDISENSGIEEQESPAPTATTTIQIIEVEQANWEIFAPVKDSEGNIVAFRQI